MTDIFSVQDLISERVAAALAVTLAGGERERLTKHHTENAEAYHMDPNSGFAHWSLGNTYVQKGMYEKAIAEHKKVIPFRATAPTSWLHSDTPTRCWAGGARRKP